MPAPFEEPRKTELRHRCIEAIDAAGYRVIDPPETIALPATSTLRGNIVGDIQSIDGNLIRYVYYLRVEPDRAIPQWLANLAKASHQVDNVSLYVVVPRVTEVVEQSAKACGAGLLLLEEYHGLATILIPTRVDETLSSAQFAAKISDARRRLENKLDRNKDLIHSNYVNATQLTAAMSAEIRDEYLFSIELLDEKWSVWAESLSTRLDEAASRKDVNELLVIELLIEKGIDE